jgi:hypothetical protein
MLSDLVPIIEGGSAQWARDSLSAAARTLASAHREGQRWDCRRRIGETQNYRPLTEAEATELVAAIQKELSV